jgi:hypothetical protein
VTRGLRKVYGKMRTQVFWDVTSCQLINSYRIFEDRSAVILRVTQSKKGASTPRP